jgi:hypothetical protein
VLVGRELLRDGGPDGDREQQNHDTDPCEWMHE